MSVLDNIFPKEAFGSDDRKRILAAFEQESLTRGDCLLHQGSAVNHYWFLEAGVVRSYAIDPEGNEISTQFFTPGDIVIDWPAFFMRTATKETFEVLADGTAWRIGYTTFQTLFHSIEAFREAGRARLVKSYFDLKRHSTQLITDTAKDRYLTFIDAHPEVMASVPLKMIASYLGMTDTSLSRIRKEIAMNK